MGHILSVHTAEEIAAAVAAVMRDFMPQESICAWGVPECATYLRIGEDTVRDLAINGLMPAFKIGKLWRFHPHDIKAWKGTTPEEVYLPGPVRRPRKT